MHTNQPELSKVNVDTVCSCYFVTIDVDNSYTVYLI